MPSTKSKTPQYSVIEPARFKLDGGGMYGIIPKPMWDKVHPSDEQNRVDLALRLWVIESGDKVIVVDTGIGDYHDEKFNNLFDVRSDQSPIEQALAQKGLKPSDVTDLVITHLHFDHVGGIGLKDNTGQWQPVFPEATCHVHKDHLEYAHTATPRDKGSFHTKNFDPILDIYEAKGRLKKHTGKEGVLFDLGSEQKLSFKCSFGHTPWLMHPYTEDMIYLADLIPTSNHIHIPWVMGYDISPGITTADKEEFLSFVLDKNLKVIFEHDPVYWGSTIIKDEKGRFKAGEKFKAKEKLSYSLD